MPINENTKEIRYLTFRKLTLRPKIRSAAYRVTLVSLSRLGCGNTRHTSVVSPCSIDCAWKNEIRRRRCQFLLPSRETLGLFGHRLFSLSFFGRTSSSVGWPHQLPKHEPPIQASGTTAKSLKPSTTLGLGQIQQALCSKLSDHPPALSLSLSLSVLRLTNLLCADARNVFFGKRKISIKGRLTDPRGEISPSEESGLLYMSCVHDCSIS